MRTEAYQAIPTLGQWINDSKDTDLRYALVRRTNDPVLTRIDNILSALPGTTNEGERTYLRFELFFATNYWLSNFEDSHNLTKMHAPREPAIRALFQCVAKDLARFFECGVQALVNEIEKYFGRSLSEHGRQKDAESAHYFKKLAEREKFKLFFKNRRVYQLPWREISKNPNAKPVLANSSILHQQTSETLKDDLKENWAFFVMSLGRDLYMAPHLSTTSSGVVPRYHSSLLAGVPVSCAGSILIEKGVVKGLRNDSGHYQPTNLHMLSTLQHLQMMQVDISEIDVYDYGDTLRANGKDFLEQNGNWQSVHQRMVRNDPALRQWEVQVKLQHRGGTDFRSLVSDRCESLQRLAPTVPRDRCWERAYREVALALGEIDQKWWKMAASPPIPYRPHRPRAPHRPVTPHGPAPRIR